MIIEFHNQMSQPDVKKVRCNGYSHAGISEAINMGRHKLPYFKETISQGKIGRFIAQVEDVELNYLNPGCTNENYLLKKSDSVRISRELPCISRFDD